MAPQVQGRPSLPELWPITLTAPSSGCLDQSWSRNLSERVRAFSFLYTGIELIPMFLNNWFWLISPWLSAGARMVRELFVMAREHAPSIIFMDEIDSIGSSRLEGGSGGDSEVQRTMLELLNQLDGFEATKNIKVLQRIIV